MTMCVRVQISWGVCAVQWGLGTSTVLYEASTVPVGGWAETWPHGGPQ